MLIRTVSDAFDSTQSLNMFLLGYMKTLNTGRGQKKSLVWECIWRCKNDVCTIDSVWYHYIICYPEEPQYLSEGMKGVIIYTRLNTSSVRNHVISTHSRGRKSFTRFYNGKVMREREET